MRTKNLLVSLFAIASVLLLAVSISAAIDIANNARVEVEGSVVTGTSAKDVSVVAGETITLEVYFDAVQSDTDVTVKAELEGDKVDVEASTKPFDVVNGSTYRKVLNIKVPYELDDEANDELTLNIEIDGKEYETKLTPTITLPVQRPSYNADIKSISVTNSANAGDKIAVDVVLKNRGYNDLDDLYVTASIPTLGLEETAYFGDLVSLECSTSSSTCDEDDEDSVSGRIYLTVPYDVVAGTYSVEVEVANDDTTNSVVKQIEIGNDFENNVIAVSPSKTVAAGEKANYELVIVNPTDSLKVYTIVADSSDLTVSADNSVVVLAAGSSEKVTVSASSDTEGDYAFIVNVISGSDVEKVSLNAKVEGQTSADSSSQITVLTIILAIVFLVLLVVLIVLIGKKPEKSEEFGESYY